jgi:hypothetical protein
MPLACILLRSAMKESARVSRFLDMIVDLSGPSELKSLR